MAYYENKSCPVCNKQLTADDDIVTCPHCGTTHHRECYNELGHCFNKDKHGTDFSFSEAQKPAENEDDILKNSDKPMLVDGKTRCIKCGEVIGAELPFCPKCGERQPFPFYDKAAPINSISLNRDEDTHIDVDEEIAGKSIRDMVLFIGKNAGSFIQKFKTGNGMSWSWSAFIFGPYYLVYRKMYKEGFLAFAIRLIIQLVSIGLYAEPFAEFNKFISSNYSVLSSGNVSEELVSQLYDLYTPLIPMLCIILGGVLALHIAIGTIANKLYLKKVVGAITNLDKKLDENQLDEDMLSMPMMNTTSLPEKSVRSFYLRRIGGTTFFAPIMAYFIYDLVTSIISRL